MPDDMDQAARERAAAAEARRRRILERGQARFSQITATYNAPVTAQQSAVQATADAAVQQAEQLTPTAVTQSEANLMKDQSPMHVGPTTSPAAEAKPASVAFVTETFLDPAPSITAFPADAVATETLLDPTPSITTSPPDVVATETFLDPAPSITALPPTAVATDAFLEATPSFIAQPQDPETSQTLPDSAPSISRPAADSQLPAPKPTTPSSFHPDHAPHGASSSSQKSKSGILPVAEAAKQLRSRHTHGGPPATHSSSSTVPGVESDVLGRSLAKGAVDGAPHTADGTSNTLVATSVAAVQAVLSGTEVMRLVLTIGVAISLTSSESLRWLGWPPVLTIWFVQISVVSLLVLMGLMVPSLKVFNRAAPPSNKPIALGLLGLIPGMKPMIAVMGCLSSVLMMLVDSTTIFLVVLVLTQLLAEQPGAGPTASVEQT